jgi:pyruvate dehydrogenase E2 component (dihydrolipoamide acetyltransferase)
MANPVIMPKQGQSVETCIITGWFKKKGEEVRTGDILFSYETDKASFDLESPSDGVLLDIFYKEGEEVPVLVNVGVIGTPGEDTLSFRQGKEDEKTDPKTATGTVQESVLLSPPITEKTGLTDGKIKISPRAKILAEEKNIEFTYLKGTGPNGRIIVRDIEIALTSPAGTPAAGRPSPVTSFTDKPLSNVRKMIAKAMHASLQNSAQLTHHMSADVRRLLEVRKKIKNELEANKPGQDITLNDMICFCVIKALKKFPEANSHFLNDSIRTFNNVNLGIAVDTKRGLMVPAIVNAGGMDLVTLSKELKSVADACRNGNVNPELLQSTAASFTISNLGAYGVEMFTPVINLPQACILGVCTIISRPADTGNGIFGFVPFIGLSLTYDHRAIDGGPATLFLKEIKTQIENFNL